MLEIYIARHGQDIDNANGILNGHRDQPLTELGIAQASNLAQNMHKAGLSFDRIYSSPLERAFQTAQIIQNTLKQNSPLKVLDSLIERNFGVLTGQPIEDIPKVTSKILQANGVNYFLEVDGAETFPDLENRAATILTQMDEGVNLIVAHGDIGKMLYASFYKLPWEDVLRQFHFGNSDLIHLSRDRDPSEAHFFKFEQHNL